LIHPTTARRRDWASTLKFLPSLDGQITSLNQNIVNPSREKYSTFIFRNFVIVSPRPASAGGAFRDRHGRGKRDAGDVRVLSASWPDESIPWGRRNRAVPIPRRCRGIAYGFWKAIALICKKDSEDGSRIMEIVGWANS